MEKNEYEDYEVIMATETLEYLCQSYPGRSEQIELLYNLVGIPGDPLPANIYIYGDAATGKTKIVQAVLSLASARYAFINCIESYTAQLLLEPILDGLLSREYSKEPGVEKCDNLMVFVKQIRIAAHNGEFADDPSVIVLDNCERLFEIGEHYFRAFQKLQELTLLTNLCVIFISQILPEKFCTDVPYIQVFFPQYTKDDVLKILRKEMPQNEDEKVIFNKFTVFFLDTFYLATRDLNELKHQMIAMYPKYLEPVVVGRIQASDTFALTKHIRPYIRASLNNVYLPGICDTEENNARTESLPSKVIQSLDLPYYAKYFLIAAFLASYNSPKDDKRLFVKNHGKKKKRIVQDQKKRKC